MGGARPTGSEIRRGVPGDGRRTPEQVRSPRRRHREAVRPRADRHDDRAALDLRLADTRPAGQRAAGFQVWDRSDTVRLSALITKLNSANQLPAGAEREAAVAAVRAAAPPGPRRVFVGKTQDRAASVVLSDAEGRARLTLTVDAAGNPRIELLDAAGNVIARIPEK